MFEKSRQAEWETVARCLARAPRDVRVFAAAEEVDWHAPDFPVSPDQTKALERLRVALAELRETVREASRCPHPDASVLSARIGESVTAAKSTLDGLKPVAVEARVRVTVGDDEDRPRRAALFFAPAFSSRVIESCHRSSLCKQPEERISCFAI